MKIHHLPLGARFEYLGEEFVKTGPMYATGKSGGQRLIPKYAVLKVLGDSQAADGVKTKGMAPAAVLEAFEDFYATCLNVAPEDKHPELKTARERFLKALGAPL